MNLRAPAILCSTRPHGETAVIARLLTGQDGIVAAYVAGGRGRRLRPLLIPGNLLEAEVRAKSESQLPFARLELLASRGPWLSEPLPAAAIAWTTALTAAALPERQPFPALFDALGALVEAVCVAPSARGWAIPLLSYEALLLRELGYGVPVARPGDGNWAAMLDVFDRLGRALARYPLAEQGGAGKGAQVLAARALLRERLARIGGE
jgi:DNA repair protein RecO (recombination protein O)